MSFVTLRTKHKKKKETIQLKSQQIRQNNKEGQIIFSSQKGGKRVINKKERTRRKQNMIDLNPYILIITLNINNLNTVIKKQRLS